MSDKKKILLICDVKGWGGWERGEKVKEYLDEYDIDLMDTNNFSELEKRSSSKFIDIQRFETFQKTKSTWTKQIVNIDELTNFMRIKSNSIRKWDLYYLLFHTMLAYQQVRRMAYEGHCFISMVTGFPTIRALFQDDKNLFIECSKRGVAMLSNNLLSLEDLRNVYDGPTYYVPRGVDESIFKPIKPIEKNAHNTFTACYVGKPVHEKGLENIIKPACNKAGVKLIINTRNYTNALSKDQMCNFYNQADVYIVASTIDGTPNPALEAAACGRPIISNRIGNMPEFIQNGENGFLVERKISEYVDRLVWMKKNFEKVVEMGKNARKTVEEGWTWKHSMEYERKALEDIFDKWI